MLPTRALDGDGLGSMRSLGFAFGMTVGVDGIRKSDAPDAQARTDARSPVLP
jgi:hypothetical protein